MPERLLLIFAKEPRPGHAKTRMCPPLTPEQAARCQRAFVSDVLDRLAGAAGSRAVLWAAPPHDAPQLADAAARRGLEIAWQGPGDLGSRMEHALRAAVTHGAAAVLVGTDSPDLPLALVDEAFAALDGADGAPVATVVLGPSHDGGYYLVGCRGTVPAIFDSGVGWGTTAVLARTLERARAAGAAVRLLAPWWDVDDFAGLRALAARVRADASACAVARLAACRRLFAELEAEGVAL